MRPAPNLPALVERFFSEWLMRQQRVSPHTIASYRDTFRLLLMFIQARLHKSPSSLSLCDLDAPLISLFLDDIETHRSVGVRTRNLRLTAIRAFFRFAAFEEPAHSAHIQRVLAMPTKRHKKREIQFLTRAEIEAILAVTNKMTWVGRRDHALLLLAAQTGMRLSELTGLEREAVILGTGAHVRCLGKGRKERCTPLTKLAISTLKAWLAEPSRNDANALFPTIHGSRLSSDAVQYLLSKYVAIASTQCPSLKEKRVTPHVFRHTAAMELLNAGVDSSVIALWLGHETIETTQVYIHAHLAMKEAALAKLKPLNGRTPGRYRPGDQLLAFLDAL